MVIPHYINPHSRSKSLGMRMRNPQGILGGGGREIRKFLVAGGTVVSGIFQRKDNLAKGTKISEHF